jgi:hypothetical protein
MLNVAQIRFLLASIDNDNAVVPAREARLFIATCDELRAQLAELEKPTPINPLNRTGAPAESDTIPRAQVSPSAGGDDPA